MSRILVVYYSRSGATREVATTIAEALGADLEELVERKGRAGLIGYARSALTKASEGHAGSAGSSAQTLADAGWDAWENEGGSVGESVTPELAHVRTETALRESAVPISDDRSH